MPKTKMFLALLLIISVVVNVPANETATDISLILTYGPSGPPRDADDVSFQPGNMIFGSLIIPPRFLSGRRFDLSYTSRLLCIDNEQIIFTDDSPPSKHSIAKEKEPFVQSVRFPIPSDALNGKYQLEITVRDRLRQTQETFIKDIVVKEDETLTIRDVIFARLGDAQGALIAGSNVYSIGETVAVTFQLTGLEINEQREQNSHAKIKMIHENGESYFPFGDLYRENRQKAKQGEKHGKNKEMRYFPVHQAGKYTLRIDVTDLNAQKILSREFPIYVIDNM